MMKNNEEEEEAGGKREGQMKSHNSTICLILWDVADNLQNIMKLIKIQITLVYLHCQQTKM
jgi:hypothetical protein